MIPYYRTISMGTAVGLSSAVVRNTLLFWVLLVAMAFGDQPRDPTRPSPAIEKRLAVSNTAVLDSPASSIKIKAIVLSHPDRGTALLETSAGIHRISLNREQPAEIVIDQVRYRVKDFNRSTIQLERW